MSSETQAVGHGARGVGGSAMNGCVVTAENVHKTFAWTPVLHGVSCTVEAGQAVAVFGPNGAGKTTLLRLLASLLKPSSGSLRLFALPADDPRARRRIGFVGHDSFLYPDLSPFENLRFYAHAYRLDNGAARVQAMLEYVGLQDWATTPVRSLSRGMEQRLALARALLHEPDLLLLDEPYTGLDADALELLHTSLLQAKQAGKTIVFSSHDFERGLALCSRALMLCQGRIMWQSSADTPSVAELRDIYTDLTRRPTRGRQA
ncbi:MAG: heme ABC exporter ATP-binding protein CcmA [Desulfurellaceae bacterium]|nr:heme ABC exporter ATP-binding protein CcmA [Desulfurellaceae bacterium]